MPSKVFLVQCNGFRQHEKADTSIQALLLALGYSERFITFQHEHPTAEVRATVHLALPGECCEAGACIYCESSKP